MKEWRLPVLQFFAIYIGWLGGSIWNKSLVSGMLITGMAFLMGGSLAAYIFALGKQQGRMEMQEAAERALQEAVRYREESKQTLNK